MSEAVAAASSETAVADAPYEIPVAVADPYPLPDPIPLPPRTPLRVVAGSRLEAKLQGKRKPGKIGGILFIAIMLVGIAYIATHLTADLQAIHIARVFPFVLLGLALFIALGFEFVNGFNDTANAVATVIYTHSLDPHMAVVWSGCWNFLGVLTASGAVAYTIVSLLPVDLILRVSSGTGYAMVFALLAAAIIWNLMTWFYGLPISSSHTMIGSIIGVGVMNQILLGHSGLSGLNWEAAAKIFKSLLFSPLIGFSLAALLFLLLRATLRDPRLYERPRDGEPPPPFIRGLLIFTCTGVSFFHGSNDGQKGMGLIMLILIGTMPGAYALNHGFGAHQMQDLVVLSEQAMQSLGHYADSSATPVPNASAELERFVTTRKFTAQTLPALDQMTVRIAAETATLHSLADVPANLQASLRNQMYLESESLNLLPRYAHISAADAATLANYRRQLDRSIRFIPTWVKVAVALALGMGTMVGWKRIVVTVGERIGKSHLTYAQGASAEIVAMGTICAAGAYGLPVSTTHVLSSGVAGTMAASKSGLHGTTIRNIAMAWVFTLPAAATLSATLYWLFSHLAHVI
jgi:PiT family inorganic phosphate transporter